MVIRKSKADADETYVILLGVTVSLAFIGLRHSTLGRRLKRSRVRASGSSLPSTSWMFGLIIVTLNFHAHHIYHLWWHCNFNGIQLGGMTSPHMTLTVSQTTKDQQAKQDCVHLRQDLDSIPRISLLI